MLRQRKQQQGDLFEVGRNAAMVLGAGLLGAGIALLVAPRSGRETRTQIKNRVNELQGDLRKNIDELIHECSATGAAGMKVGQDTALRMRAEVITTLKSSRDYMSKKLEALEKIARVG